MRKWYTDHITAFYCMTEDSCYDLLLYRNPNGRPLEELAPEKWELFTEINKFTGLPGTNGLDLITDESLIKELDKFFARNMI